MNKDEIRFVERMGQHLEAEGMPRIGGRLYGFLLLQDDPQSLDDLMSSLEVSKTSVSTNARLLEQRGLIDLVTKPGDRRDYYYAAEDQSRTLELALDRVAQMGRLLRQGEGTVAASGPSQSRLHRMAEFNDEAEFVLRELLEGLQQQR